MIQTGSLPLSGKITFDFSEEALMLVAKTLSKQLPIRATISFPDNPSVTAKIINITVTEAYPPGTVSIHSKSIPTHNFFSDIFNIGDNRYAFGRVRDYLHNQILIKMGWILIGHHGTKKIPIMVLYVPAIHVGAYSFKKDSETEEEFKAQLN